jgi:Putative peptidoglycan binding domain
MRKILSCTAIAAMIALAWSADGATTVQTKAPAKKAAAKKKAAPAKKSGTGTASSRKPGTTTKSASSRGKKTPAKRGVTWRNRQTSPTPDRYREIQGALATKGFLNSEDATGTWNQASSDAMKKFQAEQNLESSGKINSLSLIALGLGPHRDPAPPAPPRSTPQAPPGQ